MKNVAKAHFNCSLTFPSTEVDGNKITKDLIC